MKTAINKRPVPMLFLILVFAVSSGYDFYRGYHETQSITGGIAYFFFGLMILAILFALWLGFSNKNPN